MGEWGCEGWDGVGDEGLVMRVGSGGGILWFVSERWGLRGSGGDGDGNGKNKGKGMERMVYEVLSW